MSGTNKSWLYLPASLRNCIRVHLCVYPHPLPGLNCCDEQGNAPLHWAVESNKEESCRTLLDLGADPNLLNTALMSPLHLAVSLGHNNLVEVGTLESAQLKKLFKWSAPVFLCFVTDIKVTAEAFVLKALRVLASTRTV